MTEKRKLWKKFEDLLKKTIPDYILEILIQSGFDNAFSISELCEEDIKIIEEFVDKNLKHLIENSGVYKTSERFVFLPGHKKLILSLPNQLKNCKENSANKVEKCDKTSGTEKLNLTSEQVNTGEEIELLNESELNDLKKKLLSKITKTAQGIGLKPFTENEVLSSLDVYINHSRALNNKPSYKCSVKCTECEKSVPCTWNGYWQTANLEKHLKSHTKSLAKSIESSSKSKSTNTNTHHLANIDQSENDLNKSNDNNNSSEQTNSAHNKEKELDTLLGL